MAVGPALAQGKVAGFAGEAASSVPGRPFIVWRLAKTATGEVHGIAYYSDLSGLSLVSGKVEPNGKFELTLTKTDMGIGPVGTVTGSRAPNGSLEAVMTGEGCANMTLKMAPQDDLNSLVNVTGGGR
jgi:hypothetical protein